MPRTTTKGDVSGSESEHERTRSAKKQPASASKSASKDKGRMVDDAADDDGGSGDEEEDEDEEEYEIEAILDAKHGTFPEGRIGYLVKWKGYDDSHNSWVDEKDAEGAKVLIQEFWKKNKKGGRKSEPAAKPKPAAKPRKSSVKDADSDVEEAAPAKKRGRPSKAAPPSDEEEEEPSSKQKKPRKSTGAAAKGAKRNNDPDAMDEDPATYKDMRKYKDISNWEHLVESIDTVERTESGELYVYFTLKNGKGHGKEKTDICKKKMPNKLIDFYESNLRWKANDDDDDAMEE